MDVHIRWMIRRDMPEVLDIENLSFQYPWPEDDFIRLLRQRNCLGMVADVKDTVAGFMVYELPQTRLFVHNFAVAPAFCGKGIGRAMLDKLVRKLSTERRSRILANVRESNVDAQLFFRACGFRAVATLRDHFEETTEDAYVFEYRLRQLQGKESDVNSLSL